MSEEEIVQQEIAPLDDSDKIEIIESQPVEKKKNKAAAFFKLSSTRKITYMAVLIALAVTAKYYSITLPTTKISLFYIPVYLSGALFGPIFGFAVGAGADLVGGFLQGLSISPLITLGNGLSGAIFGFVFLFKKGSPYLKLALGAIAALLICTYGINSYGISTATGTTWLGTLMTGIPPRIAMQPIVLAINMAVIFPIYFVTEKYLLRLNPPTGQAGDKNIFKEPDTV
ncbi:MAG: folate family ECF transporter S component [Clostridiales bacterium]|nr:folate family ECF transporter S component [Clostridiales bacterium]